LPPRFLQDRPSDLRNVTVAAAAANGAAMSDPLFEKAPSYELTTLLLAESLYWLEIGTGMSKEDPGTTEKPIPLWSLSMMIEERRFSQR
jgi:hypothetical protein